MPISARRGWQVPEVTKLVRLKQLSPTRSEGSSKYADLLNLGVRSRVRCRMYSTFLLTRDCWGSGVVACFHHEIVLFT